MSNSAPAKRNPWTWVTSLYFTEGLPYIVVIAVSVIMYKRLGVSNADIGIYTSWLYLPWVIKPLWSPLVDLKSTKRNWFLSMQVVIALAFLGVAVTLPGNNFLALTLAFFWLAAFSSATHDIAADGYYMLALTEKKQSFFLGIRSTFYRLAIITGQGLLVVIAGLFETYYGDNQQAWSVTMGIAAAIMLTLSIYNFILVPNIEHQENVNEKKSSFFEIFASFFRKKNIGIALAFILLYRLGEAQLVKMASPFLLDDTAVGGLGLSTAEVGTIYGTLGVIALSVGGILGGIFISRDGLGKWLFPMILALNLPNLGYVLLAWFEPTSSIWAMIVVVVEQFGYGLGFAGYLMYLIYVAEGISKTAHYAIATGFMALGMMLPGMISGVIQEAIGYFGFFIWTIISAIPCIILTRFLIYPYDFGKKNNAETVIN